MKKISEANTFRKKLKTQIYKIINEKTPKSIEKILIVINYFTESHANKFEMMILQLCQIFLNKLKNR